MRPVTRLRLRLTAWYAGTFSAILAVLGIALYTVISRHMATELQNSMRAATAALEGAAQIREQETGQHPDREEPPVADAVRELVIPGRMLYLFDINGRPVVPDTAAEAVRTVALGAATAGTDDRHFKLDAHQPSERLFQAHGERFALASGQTYVAVVVADRVELEDRYGSLIYTLISAAVGAIVLVAAGGWLLATKAIEPIERTITFMRRFIADAAHELRTPVAVLRSRADVTLQRERDPAAYVDALTAVGLEAERMGRIVNDLLTLARADAGERAVAPQRLYVDDVALDAVTSVRVLAEQHGVTLAVNEFEEAPAVFDPGLLRQLLVILLDNAVKFTPVGGQVSLSVRRTEGRATVTVVDTGVGIPPNELPRIYDRFYRGDDARHRADGAGLGLSIAKWIVDAHGSSLTVASEPGRGTIVTVQFPPAEPAPAVEPRL
jgi:signal transduction histidine kinase